MNFQEFIVTPWFKYNEFEITPGAVGAIVLLFITFRVTLFVVRKILNKYFIKKDPTLVRVDAILVIAKYFIWVLYILLCLKILGLGLTWLIASSAALMVGIGLGLQNTFNDFVSGIILLFEGTVDPGDIITVDGMVGKVKKVGIRTSHIITRNNITIMVPNHKLTEDNVINWSHMHDPPRFHVRVGVAYGSDTAKVIEILLACAHANQQISFKYAPFARFIDFGESSLDFDLYFWSDEIFLIEDVMSDLRLAIDQSFRKEGITVPFPQRDLHIKSGKLK